MRLGPATVKAMSLRAVLAGGRVRLPELNREDGGLGISGGLNLWAVRHLPHSRKGCCV
jgi:hypothetical protein